MISHQELSDRMEIQNILALYCEAIDNRDWRPWIIFSPKTLLLITPRRVV